MISVSITPLYVGLTALIMLMLSLRVSSMRVKHRVSLGDGGKGEVGIVIRGFGNLTEYAPIILVMLFLMEIQGVAAYWLHAYGGAFIIARIVHPLALFDGRGAPKWKRLSRQGAATVTLVLLLVGAIVLLLP